jgi:dihydropyrimidinase
MKKFGARLHAMSRPNLIEWEAIQRAIAWSDVTDGQLYIVHMTTAEGCDLIRDAQAQGVPVLAETCAQYLVLDDSVFGRKDGHLFACCPQLKNKRRLGTPLGRDARGRGLRSVDRHLHVHQSKQKAMWKGDWTKIPMGMPGLETLLPVTYTHGVLGKRLSIEQMVDSPVLEPGEDHGALSPQGRIQAGSDADIAIIHPKKKIKVDPKKMETNADWSPVRRLGSRGLLAHDALARHGDRGRLQSRRQGRPRQVAGAQRRGVARVGVSDIFTGSDTGRARNRAPSARFGGVRICLI